MSDFTIKQIFIDNWNNFVTNCSDTTVRLIEMIDSISDDDFLDSIEYINVCLEISNEDYDEELWSDDEGWENEAAKFYSYNTKYIEENDNLPL